jgi:5-methylcytosine-specific restriction endonuclease McrA
MSQIVTMGFASLNPSYELSWVIRRPKFTDEASSINIKRSDATMPADRLFSDVSAFAAELRELHAQRRGRVIAGRADRIPRTALTQAERREVLVKTGRRCHICGGMISGNDWEADHVMAHSTGGTHSIDNYLPAHSLCNNYRWHYDTKEFQWILKLGVWARTQIEKETPIGKAVGKKFCDHDRRRAGRRKQSVACRMD